MTREVVVDTNVAITANGRAEQANPDCVARCANELRNIRDRCRVILDQGDLILREYRKHLRLSGGPGAGDAFFKWLWRHQHLQAHSRAVPIRFHPQRDFQEFPADSDLGDFDRDDRKFVAVALASGTDPEILNATDTDWWNYHKPLERHGVNVKFLCPELMPEQ